jgi:hypothetical protein
MRAYGEHWLAMDCEESVQSALSAEVAAVA